MTTDTNFLSFREQELAGWDAKAAAYANCGAKITKQVTGALLDAGAVGAGTTVLDVATGPGHIAGAAASRGANAIGVDFAPSMVSVARKNFPEVEFREGDAEALGFQDGSFDAVICGFGLGHLPNPDKAIQEAFRVLRPRGRFAFSWWCSPEKHEFFALLLGSIKENGKIDVPLPPAPPMFRFGDPVECRRSLSAAGFTDLKVHELEPAHEVKTPEEVLDLIYKSSVRAAMMLDLQTEDARQRINKAILDGVHQYKVDNGFRIGWACNVVSGAKP